MTLAGGKLGGHIGERPAGVVAHRAMRHRRGWIGLVTELDRQAPVHHQHVAEIADHHIAGLQVAMDEPTLMRRSHRLAHHQQAAHFVLQRGAL